MLIEHVLLKKTANNFAFAKTIGVYLMVIIIPVAFYSYTAIMGKSIFAIDISTFIVAVIIGQLSSYKLLTYKKLSENLNRISLIALVLLGLAFVLFTFYPPQLPIFRDPNTGKYGIPQ
jgi:amino acid transporter